MTHEVIYVADKPFRGEFMVLHDRSPHCSEIIFKSLDYPEILRVLPHFLRAYGMGLAAVFTGFPEEVTAPMFSLKHNAEMSVFTIYVRQKSLGAIPILTYDRIVDATITLDALRRCATIGATAVIDFRKVFPEVAPTGSL